MDRNFKLRQMFSDYLEIKNRGIPTPSQATSPNVSLSALSEEDKKRAACKKITEEEAETFDFPENSRPVLFTEPVYELKWYNKMETSNSIRVNSEEENLKLAQRLLQLFRKSEMLESAMFKYDDIRVIRVFFMDDREPPSERLVTILDNIFTVSMTKLGQFSDKISVVVDYELRSFMAADLTKAKRLTLESMLRYPEYVPDSWGGESALQKWKAAKEADARRRESDEKEKERDREKERENEFLKLLKEEKTRKDKRDGDDAAEKRKKEEKRKTANRAGEKKKDPVVAAAPVVAAPVVGPKKEEPPAVLALKKEEPVVVPVTVKKEEPPVGVAGKKIDKDEEPKTKMEERKKSKARSNKKAKKGNSPSAERTGTRETSREVADMPKALPSSAPNTGGGGISPLHAVSSTTGLANAAKGLFRLPQLGKGKKN